MKDGLGGGIIAGSGTNAVFFEEAGEASKVASARESWEGVTKGRLGDGHKGGGGAFKGNGFRPAGTKMFGEGRGVAWKIERSAVVGKGGGGSG